MSRVPGSEMSQIVAAGAFYLSCASHKHTTEWRSGGIRRRKVQLLLVKTAI
jgi:hypothetical protein